MRTRNPEDGQCITLSCRTIHFTQTASWVRVLQNSAQAGDTEEQTTGKYQMHHSLADGLGQAQLLAFNPYPDRQEQGLCDSSHWLMVKSSFLLQKSVYKKEPEVYQRLFKIELTTGGRGKSLTNNRLLSSRIPVSAATEGERTTAWMCIKTKGETRSQKVKVKKLTLLLSDLGQVI